MKRFISIILILCLAGIVQIFADENTFTLNVRHLKYYNHSSSGDNNGRVGARGRGNTGGYSDEILCYADLSSLNGATIDSARFKFYVTDISTNYNTCTADLNEQNKGQYNSNAHYLTYQDAAWSNSVGSKYLEYDAPSGWYSIKTASLRDLIQDWADGNKTNEGLILGGDFYHWSYYWDISQVQLYVSYTPAAIPPTNILVSNTTIDENSADNTEVGILSAEGGVSPYTFSLASSGTYPDNNYFNISGNSLRANSAFDYEDDNSYSINVKVTGDDGGQYSKPFTITVNDVNEPPTAIYINGNPSSEPVFFNENEPPGTTIGGLTAYDPENGTLTFSLAPDDPSNNNSQFNINGNSLEAAVSFNYEIKNSYIAQIIVQDDGALEYSAYFTININDMCDYSDPTVTPPPDAKLTGTSVLILWEEVEGAEGYTLKVGSSLDGDDYFSSTQSTKTDYKVENLPTDTSQIYVQIATYSSTCDPDPNLHRFEYEAASENYFEYPEVCGPTENMRVEGKSKFEDEIEIVNSNAKLFLNNKYETYEGKVVELFDEDNNPYIIEGVLNLYGGDIQSPEQKIRFTAKDAQFSWIDAGNVGIGTKSPEAKLDVAGAIRQSGPTTSTILYHGTSEDGTPSGDGFRIKYVGEFPGLGPNNDVLVFEKTDNNQDNPDDGNAGIAFVNTGQDGIEELTMFIDGNGDVGIGKLDPSSKLDVEGTITATQFKVGDWSIEAPDYVFDAEKYDLKSLDEVSRFIDIEKHLPGVPSAAAMKKEGVDLAEMSMTLLKKIEEMQLYILQLNDLLEKQNKRIRDLENKIK